MSGTLGVSQDQYLFQPVKAYDARGNGDGDTAATITGDHENRVTDFTTVVIEGNGSRPSHRGDEYAVSDKMYTLNTIERSAAAYRKSRRAQSAEDYETWVQDETANTLNTFDQGDVRSTNVAVVPTLEQEKAYIVRRLTPIECARLQGFPDWWGGIDPKDDFTDEEYAFWLEVRNTYATINGRKTKDYTKEQMLAWYNKLHTDSAEYKMWGNGIALPCTYFVLDRIAKAEDGDQS